MQDRLPLARLFDDYLARYPADAAGGIWGGLMPSYTVLDVTAQYNLAENVSVFGAVKNLTDKRYITGLRQGINVGPERTFEAGVRYAF